MITVGAKQAVSYVNRINEITAQKTESMLRLSSGYRVTSAADDAGNYQTIMDATCELKGLEVANKNTQSAVEIGYIADDALNSILDSAYVVMDIANQALSADEKERAVLEERANAIISQMNTIKNDTKYNDNAIFTENGMTFQVGYESNENSKITINTSLSSSEIGVDLATYNVDFTDEDKIKETMQKMEDLGYSLTNKITEVASKGAILKDRIAVQENTYARVADARASKIETDVAQELFNYVKLGISESATNALLQSASQLNGQLVTRIIGL
ncbi:hypothetical protein IKA15_05295 [bacterium]|nr:hypothetical protein [bacterium]